MQWEIEGGAYSVLVSTVNCEAVITPSAPLKVEIGECARIEVESALNYIESGSVEISAAVASGLDTFNEHTTQKTAEFDEHVEDSIVCAKNWAVKTDGAVDGEEYSAKYYANEAKNTLLNTSNRDLSNLTSIGIAKFTAKQDTLVSGTNIKTINGTSLLGSGDIVIQSAPNLDNKSITKNTANELQTVGVINQNNASQAIKTWTGTKAQYDAIVSKDSGTLYYLTDVQKIYYGNTLVCEKYNRNIGEIITSSIPLTDAGLHLLDGSLIQGGGIYDDFVQYIAGLVNTYPQCFCSEAEWQQSVNTYGACGKFVYNSTNNTVRLPKITGFIEGTIDSNALGDLVEAGLPNITGEPVNCNMFTNYGGSDTPISSGAIVIKEISSTTLYQGDTTQRAKWYFDASRSNSIYGNSTTVQPQSIKVFYYIVVANSTKTNIEVDIDEIVTDLNSKANNAGVVHKTGDETITGIKTFKGNNRIVALQNSTVTYNTAPSSETLTDISFRDKNGYEMGVLESVRYPNNNTAIRLVAKGADGNWSTSLLVGRKADGTSYTSAQASDASNSIVTTVNKSKAENGYFKLGNGLIIQWGTIAATDTNVKTISFSTPFTIIPSIAFSYIRTNDSLYNYTANCSDMLAYKATISGFKYQNRNIGTDANVKWVAIGY